ncbi:MAG: hypothetical protein Q8J97_00305 [Flavobacteriaceae bacterium]|nr:hypothetical protein [Flavobacteriaceae bacterium]
MDYKKEIEKITGLKLNGENSWLSLETHNTFGFDVKTKSGKVVNTTTKPLYLSIRIVNKETIEIIQSSMMKCMDVSNKLCKFCFRGSLGGFYDGENFTMEQPEGTIIVQTDNPFENLAEYYEKCVADYKQIQNLTNISGEDVAFSALHMARQIAFNRFKYLQGSNRVNDAEWQILEGAMQGGHMWTDGSEFSDCTQYDMNNMYAYAMSRKGFKFPMRSGEFKTIESLEEIKNRFGLFKLKVGDCDEQIFKKTKNSFYTHYDMKRMNFLGIKYKLSKEASNAYVYDDDCLIEGEAFFGILRDLYGLKLKGNKEVKIINSRMWGILSQEKSYKVSFEDVENYPSSKVKKLLPDRGLVEIMPDADNPCKFTTARIKTFILSYSKYIFMDIIQDVVDEGYTVHKINTDGFISNIPEDKMSEIYPISNKIGHLKVEKVYEGKWKIHNIKNIEQLE